MNKTDDVTLRCDATTDPAEQSNLKVEWLKDDEPVDYTKDTHLKLNKDFSLTIQRSVVTDTAEYVCNATNGLDSVESNPIAVTVRGELRWKYQNMAMVKLVVNGTNNDFQGSTKVWSIH